MKEKGGFGQFLQNVVGALTNNIEHYAKQLFCYSGIQYL